MSCDTLATSLVGLTVSMGSLPEGFCPANMQELANAIAARLIVTPNVTTSSFAIGSVEPSSNVGPWLKNCLEWYVFDDATGRYRPISQGGFGNQQYFTSSGTFVVPDNAQRIKVTTFGGGGGGFNNGASTSASGGGGGASGISILTVTPGQVIPFTVGAGGGPGVAGGNTTILGLTATGGGAGTGITTGGAGGTAAGFDINLEGQGGTANGTGSASTDSCPGGDAGGWGGKGGVVVRGADNTGRNGLVPGGGGCGSINAGSTSAGSGAGGAILIEY